MFSATEKFESKTHPGYQVTLKRVGVAFRYRVERELSENSLKQRLTRAEYMTINPESRPLPDLPMETQSALIKLDHEYGLLVEEERLKWIFSVLESITTPEGENLDISKLLEYAPEDFIGEIDAECQSMKGLSEQQKKV